MVSKPLIEHLERARTRLLADYELAKVFSGRVNLGTARETFVRGFLRDHIGQNIGITSGEILSSEDVMPRPQCDVILYDHTYPRIEVGGLSAVLVESTRLIIEVKSHVDKQAIEQAYAHARAIKSLHRNPPKTYINNSLFPMTPFIVVAFDGDTVDSVGRNLGALKERDGTIPSSYDLNPSARFRQQTPDIDAVFHLNEDATISDPATPIFNPEPLNEMLEVETSKGTVPVLLQSQDNVMMWLFSMIMNATTARTLESPAFHDYLMGTVSPTFPLSYSPEK